MPERPQADMSPDAIDDRLRRIGALYELGISLRSAKPSDSGRSGRTPTRRMVGDKPMKR